MKWTSVAAAPLLLGVVAQAQFSGAWSFQCRDEANDNPRTGRDVQWIQNRFKVSALGRAGQVTYGGGENPFCFQQALQLNLAGRFGFQVGAAGSRQTPFDNNMTLTPGMGFAVLNRTTADFFSPDPSATFAYFCLARRNEGGGFDRTHIGADGFAVFFVGASNRYFVGESVVDGVICRVRVDLIGDATRFQWDFVNTEPGEVELWWGAQGGFLTESPAVSDPNTAASYSGWLPGGADGAGAPIREAASRNFKDSYIIAPGRRPFITETRLNSVEAATFPQFIDILFGQSAAYGLRFDNGPTPFTTDTNGNSDATIPRQVAISSRFNLLGSMTSTPSMPDFMQGGLPQGPFQETPPGDVFFSQGAVLQKFPIPNLGNGRVVHYVRSTWSNGFYGSPFTVVVDTPNLLSANPDPSDPNQIILTPQPTAPGFTNGEFPFNVAVDNVGGFADPNAPLPLQNVRVTLRFPQGGLEFVPVPPPGQPQPETRVIDTVPAYTIRDTEWRVRATGVLSGPVPYEVTISDSTSGITRNVTGTINIAANPRLQLFQGANLVSFPWQFNDTALNSILGLMQPQDYQAFSYDPGTGYFPVNGADRGRGYWVISDQTRVVELEAQPRTPGDVTNGAAPIQIPGGPGGGFGLIGNPYPYEIPLGQLIGTSGGGGTQSLSWAQLVQLGLVDANLTFYDPQANGGLGGYRFISALTDTLKPNVGYWLRNNTAQVLTIAFPPVFTPFLPGVGSRSDAAENERQWTQSDRQWRLQLVARMGQQIDDQNFIGVAPTTEIARRNKFHKAPAIPTHDVQLMVGEITSPEPNLAQSIISGEGRREWRVRVVTQEAGPVTITWPNLSLLPRNVQFRITDVATNAVRDVRSTSGYTFDAEANAVREFKITAEAGRTTRALIGNVTVSRPARDPNAPFTIAYTLTADAAVTVRVLSDTGREIFTAARGRADASGDNTVIWNLRDNANRSVAPGTYRVEIIAETRDGERVRRVVPVNVIR